MRTPLPSSYLSSTDRTYRSTSSLAPCALCYSEEAENNSTSKYIKLHQIILCAVETKRGRGEAENRRHEDQTCANRASASSGPSESRTAAKDVRVMW